MPLSYKPKISLSKLFVTENEMVVVDDDIAIHKRWCDILPHCFNKEKINHVHNIRRFRQLDHNGSKSYVMDYELGGLEEAKGLDLINNYRLEDTSVLSTFSANNPLLQKKCIETGVAILPKELLGEFHDGMADVW